MFHYFTIKFHFSFLRFFSLIFASNFSLPFTWVIFASKRNKAKQNSSIFFRFFHFFRYFSHFFTVFSLFFAFFRFKFFASLRFSNFCFEANRNSSLFFHCLRFFSLFIAFFTFFRLIFRFASIFSLNFRLFYLRFRLRFLVFRIEVNHVKSGFFFASKRNEIFASISNFASEAKVRAHSRLAYGFLCVNHKGLAKVYRFLVRAFFSQDFENP